MCYVAPNYSSPLVSTLYVWEWSNFYFEDKGDSDEETKPEPYPNPTLTLTLLFASPKVECSGKPTRRVP